MISEVLVGQREARLEFAHRADLAVKTKELARLAGSADLAVRGIGDGTVSLASKVAGPIAIKPVTVPNVVRVASFAGGVRGSESESQVRWQAVECTSGESCWKQVGPFAERVKAVQVGLSQEELDR